MFMANTYPEIEEASLYIQRNICEPLSLSQLANHVSYSPYHFSRIFKESIGLSPLYYVSSMRLQKAKDLLLNTNLTIRDIGMEIGQQSLGTFTTRFTEKVGMTPAQFRKSNMLVDHQIHSLQKLNNWHENTFYPNENVKIEGTVQTPYHFNGFILIGLFPKPIPEQFPFIVSCFLYLGIFAFCMLSQEFSILLPLSISGSCKSEVDWKYG